MNQNSKLKDFLARFFPTFLCTYFLSCLAVGCTLSLVWSTYLLSADIRSFLITTAIVTVIVTGGHIAVVRGRPWGLWVVVAVFLACLFIVLPTYGYRPHPFSYTTGILFPLLGLLVLNSKRYREMRICLFEIREERTRDRKARAAKARR
ncbi:MULTISPECIES: hypothetical protein [Pseudomonas]|uniref:hypothetical protein n=1 Tax=Pseudomonas TaxID=286 RepID=UPI0020B8CE76|nr:MULTISPECIES: hypothetical protein [Pseudomonas]MCP3748614.1 hypothetical protein [Pseudomonas sp. SBB6]UVL24092.1 hypothetical protein LOY30_25360 [Pseudomonas donghuensis]